MIYIILGKTASGKDLTVSKLEQLGMKHIVTYTTRPPREDEIDGVNYHFVSEENFKALISSGFFAEYRSYKTVAGLWYYGSSFDSYDTDEDKLIILNPEGYYQIKKYLNSDVIKSIYIYSNIKTIKNRLQKRGDKKEEAERRIESDLADFKGLEHEVDKIIYNNEDTNIDEVVEKVLSYISENK